MLTIAAKKKHRGIKLNPVERVGMMKNARSTNSFSVAKEPATI